MTVKLVLLLLLLVYFWHKYTLDNQMNKTKKLFQSGVFNLETYITKLVCATFSLLDQVGLTGHLIFPRLSNLNHTCGKKKKKTVLNDSLGLKTESNNNNARDKSSTLSDFGVRLVNCAILISYPTASGMQMHLHTI